MKPLSFPFRNILFFSIVVVAFVFVSKAAHSQVEGQTNMQYNVNCIIPDFVEAGSEFSVTFEVSKEIGYVGPLRIVQDMPNGFRLIDDTLAYAEISTDKQRFEIFYKNLPLGDAYSFDLTFEVDQISQAVYPFHGLAYYYHKAISYGNPVKVESNSEVYEAYESEGHVTPLKMFFELPEEVIAGKEFTFVTTFKKEADYSASGKITQNWPGAFQPIATDLPNASMNLGNNNIEISWDKLNEGAYFSVAYQVFVRETARGVYPVFTRFIDEHGLKLIENTVVFVVNNEKTEIVSITEKKEKLYKIWIEYPTDVVHGSEFEFTVFIQKGKNTGPGNLNLKLPVGSEILSSSNEAYTYTPGYGKLVANWERLPASPVAEFRVTVNTKKIVKASYMISAEFLLDGDLKAAATGHIFISDENQLLAIKEPVEIVPEPDRIDTTRVFSRIDSLLQEWQESTVGVDQLKTGQVENPIENYRIQILASKKPLPNVQRLLLSMNINEPFDVHYDGEYYRYTVGRFKTKDECVEYSKYVIYMGFADAFIKRYLGNESAPEN